MNKHPTIVVNIRKTLHYDVYIGRKGHGEDGYFGNPFPLNIYSLDKSISLYRRYFRFRIETDPLFRYRIEGLHGKILGCFCRPDRCHGDVIIKYLEQRNG